jgi:hypothetical protein
MCGNYLPREKKVLGLFCSCWANLDGQCQHAWFDHGMGEGFVLVEENSEIPLTITKKQTNFART